jgi:hypothetical protein
VNGEGQARPDWVALFGAAATATLHLALQAEGPNTAFIIATCLFWAAFVFVRAWQDRGVFRRWGFRTDNLVRASLLPALVFAVAASAGAVYAASHGTLRLPLHFPLLLLLYPFWGWLQQFLVLGVVVSNLELVPGLKERRWLSVVIGAVLFGLIHMPDEKAVLATFFLELLIIPMYLRDRNLWPLGVLHGWLGALFYQWILGRDMWVENFG